MSRPRLRPQISDVPTVVRAVVWVLAARWVLARSGFEGAVKRYALKAADDAEQQPLIGDMRRAARVAGRVVRHPVLGATCLPRSIAIARVARSHGARPQIVLGVSNQAGFSAHAWVEAGGERFDPSGFPPSAFTPAGRFVFGQ